MQVGQGDVLVHGQALDLVELRRVGGVVVAAVDAARARRCTAAAAAAPSIAADLHAARCGVRSSTSVGDVEGVRGLARRVVRVVVEGVEVVVDELDLGALGDREPEPEEDVLDLAPGCGDQVQAPGRQRRVAGQGDVDGVGGQACVELAGLERRRPRLDRGLDRLARLVAGLAHGAALVGRQVAHAAQELGQLGLAAQVAHPDLLERGAVGRGADLPRRLRADLARCGRRRSIGAAS